MPTQLKIYVQNFALTPFFALFSLGYIFFNSNYRFYKYCNVKEYISTTIFGNNFSQSVYAIRPRMFLLKATFNF